MNLFAGLEHLVNNIPIKIYRYWFCSHLGKSWSLAGVLARGWRAWRVGSGTGHGTQPTETQIQYKQSINPAFWIRIRIMGGLLEPDPVPGSTKCRNRTDSWSEDWAYELCCFSSYRDLPQHVWKIFGKYFWKRFWFPGLDPDLDSDPNGA